MNRFLLGIVLALPLPALAADYECSFTITKDGTAIGVMKLGQEVGTTPAGRLYSLPASVKKSRSGKLVESTEIILEGTIKNGGESNGETGIDATFFIIVTTTEKTRYSQSSSTSKRSIARVKGLGHVVPTSLNAVGYEVLGSCDVND